MRRGRLQSLRDEHGHRTLRDIEQHHQQARTDTIGPQDVGGTDVTAAGRGAGRCRDAARPARQTGTEPMSRRQRSRAGPACGVQPPVRSDARQRGPQQRHIGGPFRRHAALEQCNRARRPSCPASRLRALEIRPANFEPARFLDAPERADAGWTGRSLRRDPTRASRIADRPFYRMLSQRDRHASRPRRRAVCLSGGNAPSCPIASANGAH